MYPPQLIVTPLTVYVKIFTKTKAFTVWCRMLHVFILLEFSIHLCFTCSPRYLCPPRVPISQLTLLLHCNKYHTTNTNNPSRHEGSVAGLGLVFIQFSAGRARTQRDWQLTYTASVSSMPRCFMAKKLKYPYQQWKETKLEEDQDRLAPVAAKSFPGSHHRLLSA